MTKFNPGRSIIRQPIIAIANYSYSQLVWRGVQGFPLLEAMTQTPLNPLS
jgi:hypothetical protein